MLLTFSDASVNMQHVSVIENTETGATFYFSGLDITVVTTTSYADVMAAIRGHALLDYVTGFTGTVSATDVVPVS